MHRYMNDGPRCSHVKHPPQVFSPSTRSLCTEPLQMRTKRPFNILGCYCIWDVTYWRISISQVQEVVHSQIRGACSQVCNCVIGAWLPMIPSPCVWLGEVLWRSIRKRMTCKFEIETLRWGCLGLVCRWRWDNPRMEHLISKNAASVSCQWKGDRERRMYSQS